MVLGLFISCDSTSDEYGVWKSLLAPEDEWSYKIVDADEGDWVSLCFNKTDWMMSGVGELKNVEIGKRIVIRVPIVNTEESFDRIIFKKEFWKSEFLLYVNGQLLLDNHGKEFYPIGKVEQDSSRLGIHPFYKYQSYNIAVESFRELLNPKDNVLTVVFDAVGPIKSKDKLDETILVGQVSSERGEGTLDVSDIGPRAYLKESNLPLIKIDTRNQDMPKGTRVFADMDVIDHGNGLNKYTDTNYAFSGEIDIKLRGHISLSYPKKQFLVRTLDDKKEKKSCELLGLPSAKKWVLNGSIVDFSLFRNKMGYDLFGSLGHHSVKSRFCEVIINGNYQGVYSLFEKIEIGKNRLDIGKDITKTDDLSGSWLVELDRAEPDDGLIYSEYPKGNSYRKNVFILKDPKKEKLTKEMQFHIEKEIDTFESALLKGGDYLSLIDTNSFIDFIIINELSKNLDAYRLSTYVHGASSQKGGKIGLGPMWDFDMAFGIAKGEGGLAEGFVYSGESKWYSGFWWDYLMKDVKFKTLLKNRYATLRGEQLSLASLTNRIDKEAERLHFAQARNFEKWDILGRDFLFRNYQAGSYEEELEYLKGWLALRIQWLDVQWGYKGDN